MRFYSILLSLFLCLGCFFLPHLPATAQMLSHTECLLSSEDADDALHLYHNEQTFELWATRWERGLIAHLEEKYTKTHPLNKEGGIFYTILYKILQKDPSAEKAALLFINSPHPLSLVIQMKFYLGGYYFHQKKYPQALDLLNNIPLIYLDNQQVLSLKFYQAYIYFIDKKFTNAFVLFDLVRQVEKDNFFYYDATYYFAFLNLFLKNGYDEALHQFRRLENVPFYDKIVPYYIAYLMYLSGEKNSAIPYIQKTLPKDGLFYKQALLQLVASIYFELGNYKETIAYMNRYKAYAPAPFTREDAYTMGYSYFQIEQLDSAIFYLKQVNNGATDTLFFNAMYNLGNAYLQSGQKENARSAFTYCMNESPHPKEKQHSLFLYAKLSLDLGHTDLALNTIKRYLRLYPSSAESTEAKDILILCYTNSNNYKEASFYVSQNNSRESKRLAPKIYYGRAIELMHDEQNDSALVYFNKILALRQHAAYYYYALFWKAEILTQRQQYMEALNYLRQALRIPPAHTNEQINKTSIQYNIASIHFILQQYPQALTLFNAIARKGKEDSLRFKDLKIKIADCYFILKKYSIAAPLYEEIIDRKAPYEDYAFFQLSLLKGISRPTEKINKLAQFPDRYPNSIYLPNALFELGKSYLNADDFSKAATTFERVLQQKNIAAPFIAKSLLNLGMIALQQEKKENAIDYFTRLNDQFTSSQEAIFSLDFLKAAYVDLQRIEDYFAYIKSKGYQISPQEEDSTYYSNILEQRRLKKKDDIIKTQAEKYLANFPKGFYKRNIWLLLAQIAEKNNHYTESLRYCDSLLLPPINADPISINAAITASLITFDKMKNYPDALPYLNTLYEIGGKEDQEKAIQALLHSYYMLQDKESGYAFSHHLLREGKNTPAAQRAFIHYFMAEYAFKQKQYADALNYYRQIISENNGQLSAESFYKMALVYFQEGNMKEAETHAFQTISRHASYEEWVIAAYILLGDIYAKQGDYFNAKASYKSIMDHTSIPRFREEAKEKYEKIMQQESLQQQKDTATFELHLQQKPLANALDTIIPIHQSEHNLDSTHLMRSSNKVVFPALPALK